jgi:hypothetical protein
MRGIIIFFSILFLFLLVGIIILYFYFEIPRQEEIKALSTVINFSIYATENNEYIKTNYIVKIDNEIYSKGETLLNNPVIVSIPTNRTVTIYNSNNENQDYYTTIYQKTVIGSMENQRVELKLSNPGKLVVFSNRNLEDSGKFIINISSTSYFNKPYLCIKWSPHIITVSTVYQVIDKLERYQLYDKCYDFNREITNESFLFPVTYKIFGDLNENDYIRLAFIDSDCIDTCSTYSINSLNETVDIGSIDIIYDIKK